MKKFRKILTLCIAIFMVMQVVLPTISQAVETVKLNIQYERPYSDDDGDGTVGNDVYTLVRAAIAIQTVFKIGLQDANGNLSFDSAYYCLRGGLGFGSTEDILAEGVDYTVLADLENKEAIMNYFKDTIGYEISEANYNEICWIVENMYLPKSEYATEMKEDLLKSAGIEESELTEDDIEVVQQIALWYFTNYDENGEPYSVSLSDDVVLANLLQINNTQPDNDTTVSYNKNRADQINTLYRYFVDNAKEYTGESEEKVPEKLELDKTLEPAIETRTVPGTSVNSYVIGPFKINETQKGNIDYTFSYELKYKTSSTQEEWTTLEIDNTMGTVYLSDLNGTALDRTKDIEDMIAGDEFYITILKDVLGISNITEFSFDISYDSYYYNTTAIVLVADADDQPVIKVEKEKITTPGTDEVTITPEEREFDLSLRKFITSIKHNGEEVEIDDRTPKINTETLINGNFDRRGDLENTATYEHSKEPIQVKQGDIITYTLRIYNEGDLDGYATEITDYIPEGLALISNYNTNFDNEWQLPENLDSSKIINLVGENGLYKTEADVKNLKLEDFSNITSLEEVQLITGKVSIKTNVLNDQKIKAFDKSKTDAEEGWQKADQGDGGLYYKDIQVSCLVVAKNTYQNIITNIAVISQDKAVDETETEVEIKDRDSKPISLTEDEIRNYESTPWLEDDDDYEPVQLKYFDLALRKFITGVNETQVDTRIPEFYIDEEGNYKYKHDKTPVEVVHNDNVTYTIRVYNEGTIAGYAEEIEDDIPEGLIFLPEDETNKEYRWKMYYRDEEGNLVETENEEEAEVIRTDYLSEANGTIDEETGKNSNLLEVFDKETMNEPDYRDIKVVFKVSQEDIPEENEDGIIINKAHITDDSDDDEDSTPDEWNEGEDDQDKEYIYVQKFDLALFKWVTQTVVTVDGKTTTTETGFKPNIGKTETEGEEYRTNEEEEPIASVTIDKKKLSSTVVKFVYNIKVVNEGDIAGYATEITDYVPEGLKFVAEDNPLWTLNEDGKITTRALETKLLEPGESAEVPVTFTWINDENNLGLKTNIAAITEDYNDKDVPDEDSDPGNEDIPNYEEEQEDDDDFAKVILTLETGTGASYIWLVLLTITIIAIGLMLIKKYVL